MTNRGDAGDSAATRDL